MHRHVVTESSADGHQRSRLETAAWPLAVADVLMKVMLPVGLPHPRGNSFDRITIEISPACAALPDDHRLDAQFILTDKASGEPLRLITIQTVKAGSDATVLSPATLPVYHSTAYFEVREKLAQQILQISGDHLDVGKILMWVASRDPMHPLWEKMRRREAAGAVTPG